MKALLLVVPVLAVLTAGCAEGDMVALNERLFAIQAERSLGATCTLFVLGDNPSSGASGGATGAEFSVSQRADGHAVIIEIFRQTDLLAMRRYDVSFFRSGVGDEIVVPSTRGNDLRARYWGIFHPNGPDGCTPLDQDGP